MRPEQRTGGATSACPSGKWTYLLRREAKEHARRLKRAASHDGAGIRPYRCPDCGLWHVGHLPHDVRGGLTSADEHYSKPRGRRRAS